MKIAIYIRTSTEDQHPENQIKFIVDTFKLEEGSYEVLMDQQSAWKDDKERTEFERIKKLIKKGELKELYVWDWDRIYRNRKKLKEFFQFCAMYKCEIHSARQLFYESFYNIPSPFDEIMQELVQNLLGWMAEDESTKKSDRVKAAVRKRDGKPTTSYKGNKWGRKTLSTQKKNKLLELARKHPEASMRSLAKYAEISVGSVHKILQETKLEKQPNMDVQDISN